MEDSAAGDSGGEGEETGSEDKDGLTTMPRELTEQEVETATSGLRYVADIYRRLSVKEEGRIPGHPLVQMYTELANNAEALVVVLEKATKIVVE